MSIMRVAAGGSTEATVWAYERCGYALKSSTSPGKHVRVKHHENGHEDRWHYQRRSYSK